MESTGVFSVRQMLERMAAFGGRKGFGWSALDERGIGAAAGDLVIIAGRTGHGKSTVLFNLAVHWLETQPQETLVLYSYEMPPEAILLRLLAMLTRRRGSLGWSYDAIRNRLSEGEPSTSELLPESELQDAIATLEQWEQRLIVIYQPDWNVEKLAQVTREIAARVDRLGSVLVDYLQLVSPPPGHYEGRETEVAATARQLKRLAVKLDCPVVAGAQITHEAARLTDFVPTGDIDDPKVVEAIARRRPQLHHLGHGGGEQEADLILGLLNYQADYFAAREQAGLEQEAREETGNAAPFEIGVIKNRNGQLGLAPLVLEARSGFIRDPGLFGR